MAKKDALEGKKTNDEKLSKLQYEVSIAGNTMVGSSKMVDPFMKACLVNHIDHVDEWVFSVSDYVPKILLDYEKKYPDKIKIVKFKCMGEFVPGKGRVWKNEKEGRNNLKKNTKSDWILMIDVDELYDTNFLFNMHELVSNTKEFGFYFRKFNFWTSKEFYRVDEPWYPDIGGVKFYRNVDDFVYVGLEHPTLWMDNGNSIFHQTNENLLDEHIFHYNRIIHLNPSEDGNFKTLNLDKVDLKEFEGVHPRASKYVGDKL